jgi:hypothetical protein
MPVCVHIAGELAGANQQRIVFQAANRLTAAKTGGGIGGMCMGIGGKGVGRGSQGSSGKK